MDGGADRGRYGNSTFKNQEEITLRFQDNLNLELLGNGRN